MLLKVLPAVIFRYDAKSSGVPWRIAYDAKSGGEVQNLFARLRARGRVKHPHGVVPTNIA
eukprot:6921885-Prymnesium_polylepis.1